MMNRHKRPVLSAVGIPLALRVSLRDFRGGLSGFRIFIACIALGVAAIVAIGSVSRSLSDGIAGEGRRILGADASFVLIHRELTTEERNFLGAAGSLSTLAAMRAMARQESGDTALVEIKAVPADYPSIGEAIVAPATPIQVAISQRAGVYGFVAEAALRARLDLKPGDVVNIGDAKFEYRGELISEPDKLAAGVGLGPRVIMSMEAFRTTGLIQPGSLVRWLNRVSLTAATPNGTVSEEQLTSFITRAKSAFPQAGWEVRTRTNVSPQFKKNLEKFTQFLTLVGLTALVVGGIGVANTVHSYIDRKRSDIATLKSVGATGGYVFSIMLIQMMLVAGLGTIIGIVLGTALPFAIAGLVGSQIPVPMHPAVYPLEMLKGAIYGVLTALTFSLGPLGRTHDIPVSALFRSHIQSGGAWPRMKYLVMATVASALLVIAIMSFSDDRRIAGIYIVSTIASFIILYFVSAAIKAIAKRLPRSRFAELRLAIANIHRPGALTSSVVLSLGIGLALLVTLVLLDINLRAQLNQSRPGETPSFFFLDLRSSELPNFETYLAQNAPLARLERVPMMRGRVVMLNGQRPEDIKAGEDASWVLEGDRGITYSTTVPDGSTVSQGAWWPQDYSGEPLVSVEAIVARGLGLKIGDSVTINVLGRNIAARIANFRDVNWRNFGINFVFVFSPNTFANAPHTWLATATFPQDTNQESELSLLKGVSKAFPTVTAIRIKDALDAVNVVLEQLAVALRSASALTLCASLLVLSGALAAGRRNRLYDTVVLKVLGATRVRLLISLVFEYGILGLATAVFGCLAGSVAAWAISSKIMKLEHFTWSWTAAVVAAAVAILVTVGLGLLGTWRTLGQKPAPYLRNLAN